MCPGPRARDQGRYTWLHGWDPNTWTDKGSPGHTGTKRPKIHRPQAMSASRGRVREGSIRSANSQKETCREITQFEDFPIAVSHKLSDLSARKACWIHGIVLALLVSLNPLTAQAMQSAMSTLDHAVPSACDYAPSPEFCCECCADCDDIVALGACNILCVNHSGLTGASINFAIPEVGDSLLTWANCWAHRTTPPDPYPPKAAVIV